MKTLKERLLYLFDLKGYTSYQVSSETGISQSTFSHIFQEHTTKLSKKTARILSEYFNVNNYWLITGNGEMLCKQNQANAIFAAAILNPIAAPLITQEAYAGYMIGYNDPQFLTNQPKYYSQMEYANNGNYVAFEVKGDSMDDNTRRSICEGDVLLGIELKSQLWETKIRTPEVFIIVHKSNGIIVRELISYDQKTGTIRCHCWNPDPEFEDLDINLKDVFQLFNIKEKTVIFKNR